MEFKMYVKTLKELHEDTHSKELKDLEGQREMIQQLKEQ